VSKNTALPAGVTLGTAYIVGQIPPQPPTTTTTALSAKASRAEAVTVTPGIPD
jgi:hypothetical protein